MNQVIFQPCDLIEKLTLEAVNLFYLGGNPNDPEIKRLKSAVALVAEAWEMPPEVIKKSEEIIEIECDIAGGELQGAETNAGIPKDKILQSDGGNEIMEVLWGLFETATRLNTKEKREEILGTAQFMAEYLGLDEWFQIMEHSAEQRLV